MSKNPQVHHFVTVASRRWCLGCDLFQQKRAAVTEFPVLKPIMAECPRNTNWAAYERAKAQSWAAR